MSGINILYLSSGAKIYAQKKAVKKLEKKSRSRRGTIKAYRPQVHTSQSTDKTASAAIENIIGKEPLNIAFVYCGKEL